MRALVLAAGVGSRLRPYTDHVPKPLLRIGEEPILAYNLELLANAGFDEIVINLHYLPNEIRRYVGDGRRWRVNVAYSYEDVLLGTAGALRPYADHFRSGTFAIVFGDNITDLDLGEMLQQHRRRSADATIALWERGDVSQSGVAEVDRDGAIVKFIEKPLPGQTESHWVNAGYVIAEPSIFDVLPASGPVDLGRDTFPALLTVGKRVDAYFHHGGLWWFDRSEDLARAHEDAGLRDFIASRSRDRVERCAEE